MNSLNFKLTSSAVPTKKNDTYQHYLVTSAIKHRNTSEEIIIYADTDYSLLLKFEKKKV